MGFWLFNRFYQFQNVKRLHLYRRLRKKVVWSERMGVWALKKNTGHIPFFALRWQINCCVQAKGIRNTNGSNLAKIIFVLPQDGSNAKTNQEDWVMAVKSTHIAARARAGLDSDLRPSEELGSRPWDSSKMRKFWMASGSQKLDFSCGAESNKIRHKWRWERKQWIFLVDLNCPYCFRDLLLDKKSCLALNLE